MDDTDSMESSDKWDNFLIEIQPQQLIQIAISGAIAGFSLWILTLLIKQVILVPIFCGDSSSAMCVGATDIAGGIATVFAAVIGLMALVRIGVFRPLLIVIAAAIGLWGLSSWTAALPWYTTFAWAVVLYGLAYTAFAWFARIRPFVPSIIVVLIVIAMARLLAAL